MSKISVVPKPAYKKHEVAAILRISQPTLDALIATKRLRAFKPTPATTRILPSDLENFINSTATAPANEILSVLPKGGAEAAPLSSKELSDS